jgi:hypothetical protein
MVRIFYCPCYVCFVYSNLYVQSAIAVASFFPVCVHNLYLYRIVVAHDTRVHSGLSKKRNNSQSTSKSESYCIKCHLSPFLCPQHATNISKSTGFGDEPTFHFPDIFTSLSCQSRWELSSEKPFSLVLFFAHFSKIYNYSKKEAVFG